LIKSKKVCLTIFCFSMKEQLIKRSHNSTLQAYNKAPVNWKNTIVVLTFADQINAPHTELRSAELNPADSFQRKITERTTELRSVQKHLNTVILSTHFIATSKLATRYQSACRQTWYTIHAHQHRGDCSEVGHNSSNCVTLHWCAQCCISLHTPLFVGQPTVVDTCTTNQCQISTEATPPTVSAQKFFSEVSSTAPFEPVDLILLA